MENKGVEMKPCGHVISPLKTSNGTFNFAYNQNTSTKSTLQIKAK